jgi:hypothetical protein
MDPRGWSSPCTPFVTMHRRPGRLAPVALLLAGLSSLALAAPEHAKPTSNTRVRRVTIASPVNPHHISNVPSSIAVGRTVRNGALFDKHELRPDTLYELRSGELSRVYQFDGRVVEFRAPSGETRRFAAEAPEIPPLVMFTPFGFFAAAATAGKVALRELEPPKQGAPVDPPSLPARRTFTLSEQRVDDVAHTLARLQLRSSVTRQVSKGDSRIDRNVVDANRAMLRLFTRGGPLTVGDIASWNEMIHRDVLDDEHRPRAGVVRGTRREVTVGGERYDVDLSEAQIGGAQLNMRGILFSFLPGHQVPTALASWIDRANQVSHDSSFVDVAGLFKEFIHIHPFMDGNGRVSRVLLDYLLIKAGFPPMPHNLGTGSISYRSVQEVAQSLADAYEYNF